MHKSTKQETLGHVDHIYKLMCQGASTVDIVRYGTANWDIEERQMYKLMKKAFEFLKKDHEKTMEGYRFEANIRFDALYRELYLQGKYRDAAYVQAQKNKINGLEIKNLNIDGNMKLAPEEARKIAKEILKNE